jgi:signal transduction histidine kinase
MLQFGTGLALQRSIMNCKARLGLDVMVDERLGEFMGDERKIKQVLLNLLSNAVKFTPEGGRIGSNARQVDGSVEISVSDTGIGISPEDQANIFEGISPGGRRLRSHERRNGARLNLGQEVCRVAWGKDIGRERDGQRLLDWNI